MSYLGEFFPRMHTDFADKKAKSINAASGIRTKAPQKSAFIRVNP